MSMKQVIIKSVFIVLLFAGFINKTEAQRFYIKVRPAPVVVARPACPTRGYVWVDGDWAWQRNAYVWHAGYWAAPPRAHAVWVPGHWVGERRGSYWVRGHWRY